MSSKLDAVWRFLCYWVLPPVPSFRRTPGDPTDSVDMGRGPADKRDWYYYTEKQRNRVSKALGYQRTRLAVCLNMTDPRRPTFLPIAESRDVLKAFQSHVQQLYEKCQPDHDRLHDPDNVYIRLLSAGRLTCGQLDAASDIIENLPVKQAVLDHGCGFCVVISEQVLGVCLPELKQTLTGIGPWIKDSEAQAIMRSWFAEHRDRLVWFPDDMVYRSNI